jgi:Ni,Fe-hydrogenase III small subunit/ferredoxin
MPWIPRGLRDGIVTTGYPRRPDGYGQEFRGIVVVHPTADVDQRVADVVEACPTGAISVAAGGFYVDRGRCILCGRCVELHPEVFGFAPDFETSTIVRERLVVPEIAEDDAALALARSELARRVKALRRSVHIRHVDAGSDGADEWEVAALTNPIYDVQRLGIYFTASPKHADLLLVTGVGAVGMLGSLQHTFEMMPEPKVVIAAGVDAISGGLIGEGYAARGGIADSVPVDVFVPGSPPTPFGLLHGILLAIGLLLMPGEVATGRPLNRRRLVQIEKAAPGPALLDGPLGEGSS